MNFYAIKKLFPSEKDKKISVLGISGRKHNFSGNKHNALHHPNFR